MKSKQRHVRGACLVLLAASSGGAHAAGLDRSGQDISAIFAGSGTSSFSNGQVMPSVTGTDSAGTQYDVGEDYTQTALSYTRGQGDAAAFSSIIDQPYGANTSYNDTPLTGTLSGTGVDLSSEAITLVGSYQISERVRVFGGLRARNIRSTLSLNGTAYTNAIPRNS